MMTGDEESWNLNLKVTYCICQLIMDWQYRPFSLRFYHYHLAGHVPIHPPWGWMVWFGGRVVYEWPWHKSVCHSHIRRGTVDWDFSPHTVLKYGIAFIHTYLYLYLDCEFWTNQYFGMLLCISWVYFLTSELSHMEQSTGHQLWWRVSSYGRSV